MLLFFLQSLPVGCTMLFPKRNICPGPVKGVMFGSQHSKGAVRSREMLEMSHCQVYVCLITVRTWVDV